MNALETDVCRQCLCWFSFCLQQLAFPSCFYSSFVNCFVVNQRKMVSFQGRTQKHIRLRKIGYKNCSSRGGTPNHCSDDILVGQRQLHLSLCHHLVSSCAQRLQGSKYQSWMNMTEQQFCSQTSTHFFHKCLEKAPDQDVSYILFPWTSRLLSYSCSV